MAKPRERRIKGTNTHTNAFAKAVIRDAKVARPRTVRDIVLHPPGPGVKTQFHKALGMDVTMEDYEDEGLSPKELRLTKASMLLPLTDTNQRWASPQEAEETLGRIFPDMLRRNVHWRDPTGDAALLLLATQGVGAHLLTRCQDGGFEIDLRWMRRCAVRRPFLPFGVRLYLSEDLALRHIEVGDEICRPTDGARWEKAKLRLRSAILAEVTIVRHLVECHFVYNNCCLVATRRTLGPDHPIRRLLIPFHYRGATINRDALVVNIGYQAILQRIFGFTWPGLKAAYEHATRHSVIESFPAELARRGVADLKNYSYGTDGLLFWESAHSFVSRYFDAAGLDEGVTRQADVARWLANWRKVSPAPVQASSRAELIDLCTHQIFNSTAFHEHVGGNLGDYVHDLAFVPAVLRDERDFDDMLPSINTSVQVYMLAVATNLSMPKLMDDWAFLMIEPKLQELVCQWQRELSELSEHIARLNATRAQRYPTFDPAHLKLSVSF